MLIILPLPRAIIAGPNSWHGSSTPPTKFKSKLAFQSVSAICSNGLSGLTVTLGSVPPAALTRMVGAPRDFSRATWAACRLSCCTASASKNSATPPLARIFLARARPRSALRPSTATLAPLSPRPSANAPPNTPVAPITTATSPLRSKRFMAPCVHSGAKRPAAEAVSSSGVCESAQPECDTGLSLPYSGSNLDSVATALIPRWPGDQNSDIVFGHDELLAEAGGDHHP